MLLDRFPDATGTLVDSAQFMLDQNTPHPRKTLLLGNLEDMSTLINSGQRFDLITIFDVLHHCIVPTYEDTRQLQTTILNNARKLLTPTGCVIVSERIIDSVGGSEFSAKMLYRLTRSKLLAKITKYFGANTAGVGVCFASGNRFHSLCSNAGLKIVEETCVGGTMPWISRLKILAALGAVSLQNRIIRLEPNKPGSA